MEKICNKIFYYTLFFISQPLSLYLVTTVIYLLLFIYLQDPVLCQGLGETGGPLTSLNLDDGASSSLIMPQQETQETLNSVNTTEPNSIDPSTNERLNNLKYTVSSDASKCQKAAKDFYH